MNNWCINILYKYITKDTLLYEEQMIFKYI